MANEHNQLPTPDMEPSSPTIEDGSSYEAQNDTPPAAAPQAEAPPAEQQAPQKYHDEKRAALHARAREARAATTTEFSGDPNDPNARYGNADQSDLGDLERQAAERFRQNQQQEVQNVTGQQPQNAAPPATSYNDAPDLDSLDPDSLNKRYKIKVDGQVKDVSLEQLLRNAQKYDAADNKFATAQRLVELAKETMRQAATPAPAASPDQRGGNPFDGPDDGNTSQQQSQINAEELANKIQIGSPAEVIEALGQLVQHMQAPQQSPNMDPEQILTTLEDHNASQELNAFAAKNREVAHPAMQSLMAEHIHTIMATDLLNAGVPREWLQQNVRNANDLTRIHKMARINRAPGVRSTGQVLDLALQAAKQQAASWLGQRPAQQPASRPQNQPAPTMQQRQDRKAALTQQPAQRRAVAPQPSQQRSEQQTRHSAFADMRRSRGQSV